MTKKKCSYCNKIKTEDKFGHRPGDRSHLLNSRCKECVYEYVQIWRKNNPERHKEYQKRYHSKNK